MHACFMVLSCLAALIRRSSWIQVQNYFCPSWTSFSCTSFVVSKKPSSIPESPFQDLSFLAFSSIAMQSALRYPGLWARAGERGRASDRLIHGSLSREHANHHQATAERCPLHRDSAEILRFAAETCLLMSTTNRFISPSHGETVNGNTLSAPGPASSSLILVVYQLPTKTWCNQLTKEKRKNRRVF